MSAGTHAVSSHLMKTTKRGRPFIKDTSDLFCTLVISLPMESHRNFFKSYPNSFTADEACANLSNLKFSQSNRAPDPKDPTRIVTTTTTTTFSMSRDMAKGICQHYMDSRLMENATDLGNTLFKDRGIYVATPKGLHVLERFITKNGIAADHILRLFGDQPICMKLLHLERRSADDDIIVSRSVIEVVWRRFIGREPNVCNLSEDDIHAQLQSRFYAKSSIAPGSEIDRQIGLLLRKNPASSAERKGSGVTDDYTFPAMSAIDWLCDHSTAAGPDEAGEVMAQFVRYGFVALVSDKGKPKDTDMIFIGKAGGAGGGAGAIMAEAEYRSTSKGIYRITKEGLLAAKWEIPGLSRSVNSSKPNLHAVDSASVHTSVHKNPLPRQSSDTSSVGSSPIVIRASGQESIRTQSPSQDIQPRDSHAARLRQILDEPALRSLFREFLRGLFCEENLSFWLDTQDFKRKFNVTSSSYVSGAKKGTAAAQATEKHQTELLSMAYVIYNTYLAPASPCELNIDHSLRAELILHINQMNIEKDAWVAKPPADGLLTPALATQLQTLVKLYERIQTYIYRLMATDSVPKFCKTDRFTNVMKNVFDYNDKHWDEASDQRLTLREEGSPTRAYITISQAANEKAAAAERLKELERERALRGK